MVFFLGIGMMTFAQSASEAPVTSKAKATTVTTKEAPAQSGECTGHEAAAKADCTFVDANGDGICDTCGKKDCKDSKKAAASTGSKCDPAACGSKSSTAPSGCCSSKGGKK